jgi:hypothetical protein
MKSLTKRIPKGIHEHTTHWESNPKDVHFLLQIPGTHIDSRNTLEHDDFKNLKLLQKLLTFKNIRDFTNKHGMDKFNELAAFFSSVSDYG